MSWNSWRPTSSAPAGRERLHYDLHTAIRGSQIEQFALYPYRDGCQHSARQLARLRSDAGIGAAAAEQDWDELAHLCANLHAEAFTLEPGKARPFGENQGVNLTRLEAVL